MNTLTIILSVILIIIFVLNIKLRLQKTENFQNPEITRIFIGKSNRPKKVVNLPVSNLVASSTPENIADLTIPYQFEVTINNRKLTITRVDNNTGWNENIYINVSATTNGIEGMFLKQVFNDMLGRDPNESEINAYTALLAAQSFTGVIYRIYRLEEAITYRRENSDKVVSRILSLPHERTIDIIYLELINRKPEPQERVFALRTIKTSGYPELVKSVYITSEAENFRNSGITNKQKLVAGIASKKTTEQEKINNRCNFVPWGPSKRACIDRCRVDRNIWGGSKCTIARCGDICNACTNREKCDWLNTRDFTEERREQIRNNPLPELNISLRGIEGDTRCLIQFIHDTRVDSYYLNYFRSALPNNGIKVLYIESPEEGLNSIPVSNLINDKSYTFILIPVKDNEKLNLSNEVVIVPKRYLNLEQ